MNTPPNLYKVVLVFHLTPGAADEELRRSQEPDSFPALLAQQPGFVEMDLVKINEEKTMSIQTWQAEQYWWQALEAVKKVRTEAKVEARRENILLNREMLSGTVTLQKRGAA